MKQPFRWLVLLSSTIIASSCSAQNQSPLRPGTLLQNDFEGGTPWAGLKAEPVGTINVAGSTQPSLGLKSNAVLSSGPLAIQNSETNLGKLTLAFDLSASAVRPVVVRVESFDKDKKRTGGLETRIYPPAPDFYQRSALDLSTLKPAGAGTFDPKAPFIGFNFSVENAADGVGKAEIRLDNVQYAKPAYYVSATGNNQNDGRTEATAFATPQKAIDLAGPGDIVAVMNGTYLPVAAQEGIVRFKKSGSPAGWISLKNYPGHKPLFFNNGSWSAIRIWHTDDQATADTAAGIVTVVPAYIEVRGLHIRGEGDVAKEKYPQLMGQAAPETNGNAISVSWPSQDLVPHHLRYADNLVEYLSGGGIGPGRADWVTIENNVVRNNCWTTIYGTSGISINNGSNFSGVQGQYTILIRNNIVSGNRTFLPWKQVGKISDGNGIIVDVNQETKLPPEKRYFGRTLIQSNVSFNNGGSGIHTFKSKRVDIVNNTVYMNSASPELTWGQLFVQQSDDVRMINNLVVAPNDQPVNTVGAKSGDQNSTNIHRANNLYFGGGSAPLMGENDIIGDPLFVNASIDHAVADFRLKSGSPALNAGRWESFGPFLDLDGKPRGQRPDIGAYQFR